MTESQMKSAVQSFRTMEYQALKAKMEFMLDTHASDHITPTHTNLDTDRPKSFYMKRKMVDEVQGTKMGKISWTQMGEVKNIVQVPGVVAATKEDEATILHLALRQSTEYKVVSADDSVGQKCLLITGIPKGYAGFSYPTKRESGIGASGASTALPMEVYYNVICIRGGGNTKLLSTYPASQSYIDSLGPGFIG
jgi:hypothetical protein